MLRKKGIIKNADVVGRDYLFVSESQKVQDAEILVAKLEGLATETGISYIRRNGEEIIFENPNAENSEYKKIILRTRNGRWLCEALDASSFLDPDNLAITHLVILPNHFKKQQDRVWELLRVLGITPENYHNIFYDDKKSAGEIISALDEAIRYAQGECTRYQIYDI